MFSSARLLRSAAHVSIRTKKIQCGSKASLHLMQPTPNLLSHLTNTSPTPFRRFSTQNDNPNANTNVNVNANTEETSDKNTITSTPILVYEGALASLTTRLKRISVTSCAIGLIGLPAATFFVSMETPAVTQAAVGGTALLAAVGSTVALHYCFSPYVHYLELLPKEGEDSEQPNEYLIKATTRNLLTMKVETIFDPKTDVVHNITNRPFCNFVAKGIPMYVHKELLTDEKLYTQLLGKLEEPEEDKSKKDDDDDLF